MEAKEFGARLRQLREQAHISLRELAGKVGIDFTYLSKIENGVMPPPSEKVILALAEALGTDSDELFALAERIPSDLAGVLKNGKTLKLLRSRHTKQTSEGKPSLPSLTNLRGLAGNYIRFPGSKVLVRTAIATFLAVAIGVSLWFAAPVKALDITLSDPSPTVIGENVSFTVTISIADQELLPIQSVTLYIYDGSSRAAATYLATCSNLPLQTTVSPHYTRTSAQTGGGAVTITATAATGWGYGYGYGYVVWQSSGYSFFTPGGYGYGYGYFPGAGATSITYNVTWSCPSNWSAGNYTAEASIVANGQTFASTKAFSLTTAAAGVPAVPPPSGTTNVSEDVRADGVFTRTVVASSDDGNAALSILKGTKGLTEAGAPLSTISMTTMTAEEQAELPTPTPENIIVPEGMAVPADAYIVSVVYDFAPPGATFNPPATLTINYDETLIPAGVSEEDLVIVYWNETAGKWEVLQNIVVDTANNTISGELSHFTAFTILGLTEAPLPAPAAFELSLLSILPAEVELGEEITISITVANTGGQSGSYEVTLKVNDVAVETEKVTLDAGVSKKVSFTTSQDTAGTYTVDINGTAGSFVVKPAPPPLVPPKPVVPPVVPPVEPVINWWLIGGIIAGVVIVFVIITLIKRKESDHQSR